MLNKLRIIFMGTPEFAVPSLDILVQNGYDIAAVITAPDKPAGRGQQLRMSAVKLYALEKGLCILQPEKLKDEDFIKSLNQFNANLFIVVAFRMLPEVVWKMPALGTFNLHGSLLPQYRGAAPINWAIINGETKTGVTTFFLQHEIDTGDLLFREELPILPEDTAGTLHDKMMTLGAQLVLKTVQSIEAGNVTGTPQPSSDVLKHAPKIFKNSCQLNFSESAELNHNKVRGLSPYPAAWMMLDGKVLKVLCSRVNTEGESAEPGSIQTNDKNLLQVRCQDAWLQLLDVQLEGKKRMLTDEFLRGYKIKALISE
jgi:methionyl-tRNA formyltransferase